MMNLWEEEVYTLKTTGPEEIKEVRWMVVRHLELLFEYWLEIRSVLEAEASGKNVDVVQKIQVDGEVNRAQCMVQNQAIIVVKTPGSEVYVFDSNKELKTKNNSCEPELRLRGHHGNYLCANGGFPQWRNSITHKIPHRHHDWILWDVHVVFDIPHQHHDG